MRALLRDPCECQAKLGGIARIGEVFFFLLSLSGMGGTNGICVNVKLNVAIFCMDQCRKCVICICNSMGRSEIWDKYHEL